MRGWLTDERKSLIVGLLITAVVGGCGVLLTAWALLALLLGTVDLARWISGGLS
ncbi:MAG: hypothetical protein ACR2OO_02540 [Thermomicrobiales bacterium]